MENIFKRLGAARTFERRARSEASGRANPWQETVFVTCPKCERRAARQNWAESLYVCPNCGHYQPIGGYYRLSLIFDHGSFRELNEKITAADLLHFPGYGEKLLVNKRKTGLSEAVVTATGRIDGMPVVAAVLDSRFFMGSMGTGVGKKITLAVEYAAAKKLPLVIFSASGGARMQEGIFSLMQMAKTSAATTGGVTASFASLGDITLAEPGALIGFAGPRVIEQTIGQKLPEGFQRSEFLEEHGFVDRIVPRSEMKDTLARLLRLHTTAGRRHA